MGPRSKPAIPCGNPGKFSIFSTFSTCPPGAMCSTIIVRKPSRAAYIPAVSPASPPPTITTSKSSAMLAKPYNAGLMAVEEHLTPASAALNPDVSPGGSLRLRLVGKRFKRADAPERLTGAVRYTGDLVLPGLLYGRLVRSPHASARILSVDKQAALATPGVVAVLTAEDLPVRNLRAAVENRSIMLAFERAMYVGQPVADVHRALSGRRRRRARRRGRL